MSNLDVEKSLDDSMIEEQPKFAFGLTLKQFAFRAILGALVAGLVVGCAVRLARSSPSKLPDTPAGNTNAVPKPEPITLEPKPTTPEPTTPEPKPTTPEPKPTTPEPKPATPEPKPTTPEPKPATPEPKPATPEPEPKPKLTVREAFEQLNKKSSSLCAYIYAFFKTHFTALFAFVVFCLIVFVGYRYSGLLRPNLP